MNQNKGTSVVELVAILASVVTREPIDLKVDPTSATYDADKKQKIDSALDKLIAALEKKLEDGDYAD